MAFTTQQFCVNFEIQSYINLSIDGGGCMRNTHCKSSFALLTGGVAARKIIFNHFREEVI